MNLLIIDDDPQLSEVIRKIMQRAGWHVRKEPDGRTGVAAACADIPDLILCDFEMEGMNGYQVLAALRANDATVTVPFILMTGLTEGIGPRSTMDLGADDHLTKPFTAQQLRTCVSARINRIQQERTRAERKLAALRGTIVSALPHAFKNPLNAIVGYADLLGSDYDAFSRQEIQEMVVTIRDSAETLNTLVDRFLYYTDLELMIASPTHYNRGATPSWNGSTDEMLAVELRKIAHRYKRDGDLVVRLMKVGPAAPMKDVLRIMAETVDNAFQFSPSNSKVTVESAIQGEQFVLTVTDLGRGMSPEEIAVSGALMQFDRRTQLQRGTGLGLAITRALVLLNSGTCEIRPAGPGTKVIISLPMTPAQVPHS